MRGPAVILTDQQRRALLLAANNETRVVLPGHPVGRREISYTVAQALITWPGAALLKTVPRPDDDPITAAIVATTPAGLAELAKPIAEDPEFLTYAARPSGTELGYNNRPHRNNMRDEPQPVPRSIVAQWSSEAVQNRAATQAAQWERSLAAIENGITALARDLDRPDIRHEIELMRRRADAIRRKLAA